MGQGMVAWRLKERVRGVARGLADQEEKGRSGNDAEMRGGDMTSMTKKGKGGKKERRFRRNAMMIALSLWLWVVSSLRGLQYMMSTLWEGGHKGSQLTNFL